MADIHGLLADPQFQQLDSATQRQVLGRVDPAFSGLSDSQFAEFKQRMGAPATSQAAPAPPPSFGAELWNQNVQPLIDVYHRVTENGIGAAASDLVKGAWNAQADQGRAVWQALQGSGGFQGMTLPQRASEAVGHGLAAALPVIGPMAAHAGENIGAGNFGAGAADVASLAGMTLGPGAVSRGVAAVPRTARAAAALDQVMSVASDVPIDLSDVGNVALRTRELASSGGAMPKVVNDFLKRATDPKRGPITFAEARDFYSNSSRIAADEMNRLTPAMKRQVGDFTRALGSAIEDSADQAGVGDLYRQGMSEYADAMRWNRRAEAAQDFAVKKLLPAGGLYGLYRFLRDGPSMR